MKKAVRILGIIGGSLGIIGGFFQTGFGILVDSQMKGDNVITNSGTSVFWLSVLVIIISAIHSKKPKLFGIFLLYLGVICFMLGNLFSSFFIVAAGIIGILTKSEDSKYNNTKTILISFSLVLLISLISVFLIKPYSPWLVKSKTEDLVYSKKTDITVQLNNFCDTLLNLKEYNKAKFTIRAKEFKLKSAVIKGEITYISSIGEGEKSLINEQKLTVQIKEKIYEKDWLDDKKNRIEAQIIFNTPEEIMNYKTGQKVEFEGVIDDFYSHCEDFGFNTGNCYQIRLIKAKLININKTK